MTGSRRPADPGGRRGAGSQLGDDTVASGTVRAPLRVVIIDSHEMVRAGLQAMVADHPEVRVVGEGDSAHTGVTIAEDLAPDVVLTEMRLRDADGPEVCRALRTLWPDTRVVILTVHDDEESLYRALQAGARGYLLKRVSAVELISAMHRVRAGEVVIDPSMASCAAAAAPRVTVRLPPGPRLGLTVRESEVLALLLTGMSNSAIARRLVVGEQTVKTHVRAIYRKLGVHDRDSVYARALREGLFPWRSFRADGAAELGTNDVSRDPAVGGGRGSAGPGR